MWDSLHSLHCSFPIFLYFLGFVKLSVYNYVLVILWRVVKHMGQISACEINISL